MQPACEVPPAARVDEMRAPAEAAILGEIRTRRAGAEAACFWRRCQIRRCLRRPRS